MEFYIRDTSVDDFEEVRKFLLFQKTTYIGPPRRHNISLESFYRHYATYRLLAFETPVSHKILGYAEFRNYPYIFALPGEYWLDFLKTHYCLTIPVSVTNTLFMNYCSVADGYSQDLLKSFLTEVFFREVHVRYILSVEPPDARLLSYYGKFKETDRMNYYVFDNISQVFYPRVFSIETCKNTQKLHVMLRKDLVSPMSFRKALPEDNDDIIEVIDVDRPDLRNEFGDYFIAEELLRPGIQHNVLIVTEINNQTAGFVWLNDNVDVVLLLDNYEVDMFCDIIKYDPKKPVHETLLNVVSLEKKPTDRHFTFEAMLEAYEYDYVNYADPEKISAVGLNSFSTFRIYSFDGQIITSNDRYFTRQKFLQTLQNVSNRLHSNAHYSYRFNKRIELRFNVNESDSMDIKEFVPSNENCNVFALQLFGMHRNYEIRRMFKVIMAAFAAYSHSDYCVFSLPVGTVMTENLRFILKYFVRMSPRPCCSLTDELYITHRSSLFGEITLHNVRVEDVGDIEKIMLYNIPHLYDDLLSDGLSLSIKQGSNNSYTAIECAIVNRILEEFFNNPFSEYTIKTIRCGRSDEAIDKNILIGFVILRPFRFYRLLAAHYLSPRSQYSFVERSEIVTLRLHPFYHHQFGIIFRELKRLTYYFEFYYIQSMKNTAISLPNDLVLFMQPVEPRPYKKISKAIPSHEPSEGQLDKSDLYDRVNYVTDYYAVYCHNLCNLQPCGSDRPLVILGFSPICKAFLRSYIFNWNIPHVKMPNKCSCVPQLKVVVITEPGIIEAEYDKDLICDTCVQQNLTCFIDGCNWSDYVADVTTRMDVRKYIHYTSGHIKSIDRNNHHVIFHNDCHIYYDQLLLLCDTSFGCPKPLGINDILPPNYIQINSRFDRIAAFHKINHLKDHLFSVSDQSIVIYGAHLRTFEFIQFLLVHGIPTTMIKLVIPNQKGVHISEAIFNQPVADERLEMILQKIIADLGIQVYENLTFSNWNCYNDDTNISSVEFVDSYGKNVELDVDIFVSFYETYISSKLVEVLRQANIKMNHRNIIVDADFRTSDPAIYAMGNYIQHKVEPNHQYKFVSHKESAEKLIYKLGLIPAQLTNPYEQKFSQPHSCEVVLPLGYRMFKAVMPKRYLVNHLDNEFTHSLITYDGSFSRVRLNPFGIIEEIVCVTQENISFQFLLHFIGRHEMLLNNMRARWCNEEITCFLEYFQEPWTELILHELFHSLLAENRKILLPVAEESMDLNIERSQRNANFRHRAQKKDLNKALEAAFLKFIRTHIRDIHQPLALPEDFPQNI